VDDDNIEGGALWEGTKKYLRRDEVKTTQYGMIGTWIGMTFL
jgi:hypothetical protein